MPRGWRWGPLPRGLGIAGRLARRGAGGVGPGARIVRRAAINRNSPVEMVRGSAAQLHRSQLHGYGQGRLGAGRARKSFFRFGWRVIG